GGGESGRRIVVVGEVAARLLQHRDGALGLAQLEVGRQAMRVEHGALFLGLGARRLAFQERRPFRRYFVVAAVVLGVGARIDERAVDPGAIVGRDRERGVGEYVAARVLEFRDALRALRMIGRQPQRAIETLGRRA